MSRMAVTLCFYEVPVVKKRWVIMAHFQQTWSKSQFLSEELLCNHTLKRDGKVVSRKDMH